MRKKQKTEEPTVRCIMLNSAWPNQCQRFRETLGTGSTTSILSIRELINKDPIAAKRALQTVVTYVKEAGNHHIASISRDMVLVTPFSLEMAG